MARILKAIGAFAAFAVAGSLSGPAAALPIAGSGKAALQSIELVEKAQYDYGGQSYCWYDDGWNGPGWYVCGQYTVGGVGWGGGVGWHGWVRGGRGAHVSGRTGGGRTGGHVSGRTGGGRTGGHVSGRTGGGRTGGHASGRTGGGRTGGGGGGRRSDILLKHDIALIGRLDNGLGFYRFSYNGSDTAYVGVMAQDVQAVVPEAVARGAHGYLRVRYDMLGVTFQTYERWLASGAIVPSGRPVRH